MDAGGMTLADYKLYPNAYTVVSSDGFYTKHYYAGSRRIATKLKMGAEIFIPNPGPRKQAGQNGLEVYLKKAGIDQTELEAELERGQEGKEDVYWLHGDQLGTANYVTNTRNETTQFFLNLPFGETMAEQMNGAYNNPYKFNAKELDDETGLYYYGARYYNPRISIWYGTDPLTEEMPSFSPYVYCFNNPIRLVDPDGMKPGDPRTINVFGYVMYKNASGWHYMRNSSLDKTATRIEGTNWHGDEHVIYNPYNGKNYTLAQFREQFSKAKLERETLKETLKRSWKATKEVAKIAWKSPETQPILLAPVFAASEIIVAGEIAPSTNAGRSIILSRSSGSARALSESEPLSAYTYLSGDGKTAVSNFIYDAEGKAVLEVNFKQHTQTMLSGHGHTLEGTLEHTDHILHSSVPSEYKIIPKNTNYSQPLAK